VTDDMCAIDALALQRQTKSRESSKLAMISTVQDSPSTALRALGSNDRLSAARVLNMSTGPVEISEAVKTAMTSGFLSPHLSSFWDFHDSTLQLVGEFLGTRGRVLAFPGTIRSGLDVSLANFVGPGTRVLALENGYWGRLIGKQAESYGGSVTWLSADSRTSLDPESVSALLAEGGPFDIVTVVHVETNTGIVNPIELIGPLTRSHGALFLVDTACSAGGMPISTDAWGIDIGVTGSHKCLCAVSGLAIVTLSEHAWDKLAARKGARGEISSDFRTIYEHTIAPRTTPPFTQPTTLFYALHAALAELNQIGKEQWFKMHQEAATLFSERMRDLGFRMVLDADGKANAAPLQSYTVMAVEYPKGVADEVFRRILLEDMGIFILGNLGRLAGQSFRLGLMSPPQLARRNLLGVMAAIEETAARLRTD
jgi:alanine-glyoxylate transaminase/serine-glyoxylate transaminase/serine-pyruvate transaminase